MLSVVLPTISGREHWLEKARSSFVRWCDHVEILVYRDLPAQGIAWQLGAEKSVGDYILFGADDVEMHEGWWQAAASVCDRDLIPAPLIFNSDGSLQSCGGSWERMEDDGAFTDFTRGPFLSRKQWDLVKPMIPTTYYTDNWVSYRASLQGMRTVVCHGFSYTHHMAQEGRDNSRMGSDGDLYNRYVSGELEL